MKDHHTIAKFQRIVFEIDASPNATDEMEVRFPLSELVAVAHKIADYEKFIAELNESLKDGDEKRRILRDRIDLMHNTFPQSSD